MTKPNCYKCKYRRDVPGDAHSSCHHPQTRAAHDNSMGEIMAIFASVGRSSPQVAVEAAEQLNITAKRTGIVRGWFNWPWNFDPRWLTTCIGFEWRK